MLGIRGFNTKKCRLCGEEGVPRAYIKGYGYICEKHLIKRPYDWRNEVYKGKRINEDFTWGIELEFRKPSEIHEDMRRSLFARLAARGYIPTEDGTISDTEWKSPIFQSRQALITSLRSPMQIYSEYFKRYIVSTHIHLGSIPSTYYWKFEEVQPHLGNVCIDERLWGRLPNDYCHMNEPDDRYFFVNLKTGDRGDVEFRLPRITTYRQLLLVTLFIKRFIKQPEKFEKIQEMMVKRL